VNAGHRPGEPDVGRSCGPARTGLRAGPAASPVARSRRGRGDDLRLDLGAAETRRDAAEPQELPTAAESSVLVSPSVTAGSIGSARAAVFARCDLGGDHAPGIVSPQRLRPLPNDRTAWIQPPTNLRRYHSSHQDGTGRHPGRRQRDPAEDAEIELQDGSWVYVRLGAQCRTSTGARSATGASLSRDI
jgi:hypothetical protein